MEDLGGGHADAIYVEVFLAGFGQLAEEPAYVEATGGVAHEGEGVAGLEFAPRDALGQVLAKTAGARDDRGGGEVIEVVQDRGDLLGVLLPGLELLRDAGEVLQLTEGVEARKSRH